MPFILVSLSQEHTRLCPVLCPLSRFTFPKCRLCSLHTKFSPHPKTQAASSGRFSPAPQSVTGFLPALNFFCFSCCLHP